MAAGARGAWASAALLLVGAAAWAQEPAGELAVETSVNGYLDSRFSYTHVRTDVLPPSDDVPSLSNLTEGNLLLKLRFGEAGMVLADASFVFQAGRLYYGRDEDGERVQLPEHDVPALRPLAVLSELYGSYQLAEHAHFTLGKKRIVWGPGFAVNPTDLLNPPKDPTDPTQQRAGSWLARLELPFERATLSLVGAAKVLRQSSGIPTALLYYPDYPTAESGSLAVADDRDGDPHFMAVARLYALVADTDLNLLYAFGNRYNDAFRHKHRVGGSFSRIVSGGLEAHGEVLLQSGSPRDYADPACAGGALALLGCVRAGNTPLDATQRDDPALRPKVLAGLRYMFESNATLAAEYYYDATGYSAAELRDYLGVVASGLELLETLDRMGLPAPAEVDLSSRGKADPGSPQKYSFEPLRRHYLFLSYVHPQLNDDFNLSVVLLGNLEDFSGQLAPQLTWNVRQWLALTAGALIPFGGLKSQGVEVQGVTVTEFGLTPVGARGYLAVRAYY